MTVNRTVAVIVAVGLGAVGRPLTAQQWEGARCDLNTKHYLVNSGVLYLKSATETKFVDKRAKDLKDADKVLHEALATGGQEKNPAAWYYLARYYALQNDLAGEAQHLAGDRAVAERTDEAVRGDDPGDLLNHMRRPAARELAVGRAAPVVAVAQAAGSAADRHDRLVGEGQAFQR